MGLCVYATFNNISVLLYSNRYFPINFNGKELCKNLKFHCNIKKKYFKFKISKISKKFKIFMKFQNLLLKIFITI